VNPMAREVVVSDELGQALFELSRHIVVLEVYMPYQESLFKVDNEIRDLTRKYLNEQADGKTRVDGTGQRDLLLRTEASAGAR
jgi:hypothetical protein